MEATVTSEAVDKFWTNKADEGRVQEQWQDRMLTTHQEAAHMKRKPDLMLLLIRGRVDRMLVTEVASVVGYTTFDPDCASHMQSRWRTDRFNINNKRLHYSRKITFNTNKRRKLYYW